MLLFFRLTASNAGVNEVVAACSLEPIDGDPETCTEVLPGKTYGDCGNPFAAKLLFSAFTLISSMIIADLYVFESLPLRSMPFTLTFR